MMIPLGLAVTRRGKVWCTWLLLVIMSLLFFVQSLAPQFGEDYIAVIDALALLRFYDEASLDEWYQWWTSHFLISEVWQFWQILLAFPLFLGAAEVNGRLRITVFFLIMTLPISTFLIGNAATLDIWGATLLWLIPAGSVLGYNPKVRLSLIYFYGWWTRWTIRRVQISAWLLFAVLALSELMRLAVHMQLSLRALQSFALEGALFVSVMALSAWQAAVHAARAEADSRKLEELEGS